MTDPPRTILVGLTLLVVQAHVLTQAAEDELFISKTKAIQGQIRTIDTTSNCRF